MQKYYDVVTRSRDLLNAAQKSSANSRTVADYTKKRLVLERATQQKDDFAALITEARKTKKISSWFANRAALTFYAREELARLMKIQQEGQRALDLFQTPKTPAARGTWCKVIDEMEVWAERLQSIRDATGPAKEDRENRHSKLKDIRGLPVDWRERIVKRLGKYRLAALTSAVTGCRPDELLSDELKQGVQLSIENGKLIAHIVGSKNTAKSGQPWRQLFWSVDHSADLIQELITEVLRAGGALLVQIDSTDRFCSSLRAAGQREWPVDRFPKRKGRAITSYCFRHGLASDMKRSGLSDEEISKGLGHRVDATKSRYGLRNMGAVSGGLAPEKVEAALEVKNKAASKKSQAMTDKIKKPTAARKKIKPT